MSGTPAVSHDVVRYGLDVRRLPWIRPLVGALAYDFPSVATLFAGNPADPAAWRETIARVQRAPRDRSQLAALLDKQLERRGAPAESRTAAAVLGDPRSVAIVTGQQAGVFGGPLYTLLKAVTALQLAHRVQEEHGTPAVAVFWVDEEDHDWDEIRTATVLDADLARHEISLADVNGARRLPVSALALNSGIDDAVAELERVLAPGEFTADLLTQLRMHYRAGAGVAAAFAGWLEALLGRHGLVVFEAADRAAKPIVADLFAREFERPGRTAALARDAALEMTRLGHQPQVDPADDSVGLFYVDSDGRRAIKRRDSGYLVGEEVRALEVMRDEARASPERFSPSVLLRPLVQDRIFPTVCYVGGPSELAYHTQLKAIYKEFGIEVPLLYSRATATLLDSATVRFLERQHLSLETLQAQDDSALNRLLESQLPPTIERLLGQAVQQIEQSAQSLRSEVAAIDPTLSGAVDTTLERVRENLRTLQHKIVQASKRKDDTLRRQFAHARALAFPAGEPQERALSLVFFLNRCGPALCDRLLDALPFAMGEHYVLTL
jgi:bacillithiol biosynthesis cysteine-adding enzyme BshC